MPAGDEEHERTRRLIEQLMATQEPAPVGARARMRGRGHRPDDFAAAQPHALTPSSDSRRKGRGRMGFGARWAVRAACSLEQVSF